MFVQFQATGHFQQEIIWKKILELTRQFYDECNNGIVSQSWQQKLGFKKLNEFQQFSTEFVRLHVTYILYYIIFFSQSLCGRPLFILKTVYFQFSTTEPVLQKFPIQ